MICVIASITSLGKQMAVDDDDDDGNCDGDDDDDDECGDGL